MSVENLINNKSKVVLISHINPDGDAVGSLTAFYAFLKDRGVMSHVLLPNMYSDNLEFLNRDKNILIYNKDTEKANIVLEEADLIVCLDFNSSKRIGEVAGKLLESNAHKILIDHHLSPNTEEFDTIISDVQVSSTCELLMKTFLQFDSINNDITRLSHPVLQSLATGMLTDTNNFRNSVHPFTFQMASMLIAQGIDFEFLNNELFSAHTENRMRLLGEILQSKMVVNKEYGYAYIVLTQELQDKYFYETGDSEGFVNMPLLIKGVEISAFFRETPEVVRVSLRSKGKYSVNALSKLSFNGGGHERASGGSLNMGIDEVADYFETKVVEFIKAQDL